MWGWITIFPDFNSWSLQKMRFVNTDLSFIWLEHSKQHWTGFKILLPVWSDIHLSGNKVNDKAKTATLIWLFSISTSYKTKLSCTLCYMLSKTNCLKHSYNIWNSQRFLAPQLLVHLRFHIRSCCCCKSFCLLRLFEEQNEC